MHQVENEYESIKAFSLRLQPFVHISSVFWFISFASSSAAAAATAAVAPSSPAFHQIYIPSFWKIFRDISHRTERPAPFCQMCVYKVCVRFRFGKCCPNLNTSIKCDKLDGPSSLTVNEKGGKIRKLTGQTLNLLSVNEWMNVSNIFGSKHWWTIYIHWFTQAKAYLKI